MFTIPINLRFAGIALGLLLGIGLWVAYGFWYGFLFLIGAIVLIVGYILLGTVQSSAMLVQAQDFAGAEAQLKKTYFPQWLFSANRAYYYMISGTIAMQKKDYVGAESHLQGALDAGLPSDNEKAVAILQLSNVSAMRNNWPQFNNYVAQAKKLNVTEPMIKEQLKELDKAAKQRVSMKPGMQGMTMRPGGKRKMPRQR